MVGVGGGGGGVVLDVVVVATVVDVDVFGGGLLWYAVCPVCGRPTAVAGP